jgi:hypothetical protein
LGLVGPDEDFDNRLSRCHEREERRKETSPVCAEAGVAFAESSDMLPSFHILFP